MFPPSSTSLLMAARDLSLRASSSPRRSDARRLSTGRSNRAWRTLCGRQMARNAGRAVRNALVAQRESFPLPVRLSHGSRAVWAESNSAPRSGGPKKLAGGLQAVWASPVLASQRLRGTGMAATGALAEERRGDEEIITAREIQAAGAWRTTSLSADIAALKPPQPWAGRCVGEGYSSNPRNCAKTAQADAQPACR
jgi:hypothetical protein